MQGVYPIQPPISSLIQSIYYKNIKVKSIKRLNKRKYPIITVYIRIFTLNITTPARA